jgi:hypothetical protein
VATGSDLIAAQSHVVIPFRINNHAQEVVLEAETAGAHQVISPLTVRARATLGSEIAIMHCGRKLAAIQGREGTAQINPMMLGRGRVNLVAVAVEGEAVVSSAPLELELTY